MNLWARNCGPWPCPFIQHEVISCLTSSYYTSRHFCPCHEAYLTLLYHTRWSSCELDLVIPYFISFVSIQLSISTCVQTVRLADLLDEAKNRCKTSLETRAKEKGQPIDPEEIEKTASIMGYAAVKYMDLKNNRKTDYKYGSVLIYHHLSIFQADLHLTFILLTCITTIELRLFLSVLCLDRRLSFYVKNSHCLKQHTTFLHSMHLVESGHGEFICKMLLMKNFETHLETCLLRMCQTWLKNLQRMVDESDPCHLGVFWPAPLTLIRLFKLPVTSIYEIFYLGHIITKSHVS